MSDIIRHSTQKPARRVTRASAFLAAFLILILLVTTVLADYVGTGTVQISLDPASVPVVANGLGNGDVISYILQQAPRETNGAVHGMNAYATAYVPDGVRVVNTEFVELSSGQYLKVAAEDVAAGQDGCGSRNCRYPSGDGNVAPNAGDGKINEVQQDSGIFYSTDSRTALAADHVNGVGTVDPTGVADDQKVFNQWDYDQVKAFGETSALSGNQGKGNTPVFPFGAANPFGGGNAIIGTGAPVAGPQSWYTNDYNPACNGGMGSTTFEADVQCVGPWNRIRYVNGKIGGDRVGGATITADAVKGNTLANTAVLAVGVDMGLDYGTAPNNALPDATNAVRYVFGERVVGDLELARITFEILDIDAYNESVLVDGDFCMDGTGGDHVKPTAGGGYDPRGPQDNNWRYYESNNHNCYEGEGNAGIVKDPTAVNGTPIVGNQVAFGDIVSYEMTFYNTTNSPLYQVMITDTAGSNLLLVEEGAEPVRCDYDDYRGDVGGINPDYSDGSITTSAGATANWLTLPEMAANSSVTVHVCGEVQTANSGEEVINGVCATYDDQDSTRDITEVFTVCDNTILLVGDPTAISLDSIVGNSTVFPAAVSVGLVLMLLAGLTLVVARRRPTA